MRCYESEDYAPLLRIRMEAASSDVVLARGYNEPPPLAAIADAVAASPGLAMVAE